MNRGKGIAFRIRFHGSLLLLLYRPQNALLLYFFKRCWFCGRRSVSRNVRVQTDVVVGCSAGVCDCLLHIFVVKTFNDTHFVTLIIIRIFWIGGVGRKCVHIVLRNTIIARGHIFYVVLAFLLFVSFLSWSCPDCRNSIIAFSFEGILVGFKQTRRLAATTTARSIACFFQSLDNFSRASWTENEKVSKAKDGDNGSTNGRKDRNQ